MPGAPREGRETKGPRDGETWREDEKVGREKREGEKWEGER